MTTTRNYARHEDRLTSDSPSRHSSSSETHRTESPKPPRHSLAFILDQAEQVHAKSTLPEPSSSSLFSSVSPPRHPRLSPSPSLLPCVEPLFSQVLAHIQAHAAAAVAAVAAPLPAAHGSPLRRAREERRKARACTVAGCPNYTIDRGLCFRHGGGKQCSIDGCSTSAKHRGLCWKHGGSTGCTVDGCTRGAKSKGFCWSHGGANKCTVSGCAKMTISKGLCWTHGGGKRCSFESCKRPASKKTLNFCAKHGAEVSQVDYVFEV